MEVFRISAEEYASKLSASGSANRWNKAGEYVMYTGSSRSLSTLELVVHQSAIKPKIDYKMMVIFIPDEQDLYREVKIRNLPANWKSVKAYTDLQTIGSEWYNSKESLLLKVPSAIIHQEYNYMINTSHPDFGNKVKLINVEDYFWDGRLIKSKS